MSNSKTFLDFLLSAFKKDNNDENNVNESGMAESNGDNNVNESGMAESNGNVSEINIILDQKLEKKLPTNLGVSQNQLDLDRKNPSNYYSQ